MLEAYTVGVKLEMTTNVGGVLDKLMADLEKFNELLSASSANLGKMARGLREWGKGSGSAVANLEKVGAAMKAAETAGSGLTGAMRRNAEYASEMARALKTGAASMEAAGRLNLGGSGSGGQRSSRFSEHNVMMGGIAAGMVSGAMIDALRHTMTPAIDLARTRDVMAADMRLTPEQLNGALERAREVTKLAPGTTTGENLAAMLDLKTIFGDMKEAQHLLPEFARMTALYQAMDRKSGGHGDQAFAAGKALEVMAGMVTETEDAAGHTVRSIDPDLGMARLKMMERVAVATNMRVMPSDYLGFAKQARVAGMTLTDEFTYEQLPALLGVLGGPRTGTALMSMAQVFHGDKLTAKSMQAMQEIGLAGEGGITHEGGHRNRRGEMVGGHDVVHSDAIYDLALMGRNPLQYLEAAQKRMEAKGIHGTEAQIEALMRAAQRSTIAGIFADILKDTPAILKEQQNILNTRPDMAEHMAAVDPAAKVRQFEAALTNLATEMGSAGMGVAMSVLDKLTGALTALGEAAHAHPNMAAAVEVAAGGLATIGAALSTLGTAIVLWRPALKLLGFGGGAAARAAAVGAGGPGAGAAAAATSGILGILGPVGLGAAVGLGVGAGLHALGVDDPEHEKQLERLNKARRADPMQIPQDGYGTGAGRPEAFRANPLQPQSFDVTVNGQVDGQTLIRFVAKGLASELNRPPSGVTGFDARMSPTFGGATYAT